MKVICFQCGGELGFEDLQVYTFPTGEQIMYCPVCGGDHLGEVEEWTEPTIDVVNK